MTISNSAENSILDLIYSATAWANVADNTASSPLTNIHVALATADPGDAGTMSTSEAAYGSYARVNVARSSGWTAASGGSISPAANIDFATSSGSGSTITHWQTGKTGGGTAVVFFNGAVSPTIAVGAAGVTPRLTTASTITLD